MAQLSRPYQVALAAIALLAAVWLLALRGHSSGGGQSTPAPAAKPSTATGPGSPSTPYKGSAPGVAGLTRAIQKAHGAVAQSERNAKQLEEKSAQASRSGTGEAKSSGATSSTRTTGAPPAASKGASEKQRAAEKQRASTRHLTRQHVRTQATNASGLPARQAMVERELKRGFTAAILFWNPAAADDVAVRGALRRLLAAQQHKPSASRAGRELGDGSVVVEPRGGEERIALHEATAAQVASYGSFTRAVQVYQTPTLVLLNPRGQATVLTGFADAFSIEQALDEPQA